jgi:type II secretory pathway pseudopilin PulG
MLSERDGIIVVIIIIIVVVVVVVVVVVGVRERMRSATIGAPTCVLAALQRQRSDARSNFVPASSSRLPSSSSLSSITSSSRSLAPTSTPPAAKCRRLWLWLRRARSL